LPCGADDVLYSFLQLMMWRRHCQGVDRYGPAQSYIDKSPLI
jgi:hypothetical protein